MNPTPRRFLSLMATMILATFVVSAESSTVNAQTGPYLSKTDSALEYLLIIAQTRSPESLSGELREAVTSVVETGSVRVSIRFDHKLSEAEIADLEALGLKFVRINAKVAHSGMVYGADLPVTALDAMKGRVDILRIESVWQPGDRGTLDLSVPEMNADDMWQLLDASMNNITGQGITVVDFDTGVDVFHPDFWNADGGAFAWIDTNMNGLFDPWIDAVDLNGNSSADADEALDFFDAEGAAGNNDGVYQADMDWLYNDANANGLRDYGTATGFVEADPTYGERLFIADDINGNNTLDVGENVIALGSSKIARTLNTGGLERVRGTDLILTDADTNGHGTSVCGIVNGGTIGRRHYVGVAPDAELLVADRRANDYTVYIPWASANGADVMIYEFGGWTGYFLDGSSNIEAAVDAAAATGIVQVVPAGNLGGSDKHAQDDVAASGNTNFAFNVQVTNPVIGQVWITALWRTTGNDVAFALTTPGMIPITVNLPAAPGDTNWHTTTTADGHTIGYRREDSSRGTAKYDITIVRGTVGLGVWTLEASNSSTSVEHVDVYISDDQTAWANGAVWTAFQSENNTITRPATADSAITVASYSTRGWGTAVGDLATFSPTGPRVDGQAIMDITAPGNFDIGAVYSKDADAGTLGAYDWFGGTSASGPHVAGASALLLQWDPTLTHAQIKTLLQQSARTDAFTGLTPNDEWGFGKLDVLAGVNEPPVADANGPYVVECAGTTMDVMLDGTGSSDPNAGDLLTYSWTTDCSGGSFSDATSPTPTLTMSSGDGCMDCTVSLTVTDLGGLSDTASAMVTVEDTIQPMIACPMDITVECTGQCGTEADDPQLSGFFTGVSASDSCDPMPMISNNAPPFFDLGPTVVTFTATDACGNFSSCTATVTVVDTTPPEIDVTLDRYDLWPPNHKLVDITATVTITDVCDPDASFYLAAVTSDEPDNGQADGNTIDDIQGVEPGTPDVEFQLRSERSGTGDGRTYTVFYTAYDACDTVPRNTTDVTVQVEVPHDRSGRAMSSTGFTRPGKDLVDTATSFALVVPSTEEFDAQLIDVATVQVGNTLSVIDWQDSWLSDVDQDGLLDLVVVYSVAEVQDLRAITEKKDSIAFRYETLDGEGYLVLDIFSLGRPVDSGPPPTE